MLNLGTCLLIDIVVLPQFLIYGDIKFIAKIGKMKLEGKTAFITGLDSHYEWWLKPEHKTGSLGWK